MPKAAKQSTTNREATGAAKRAPKKRPSQLKTSAEKAELKLRRHPTSEASRAASGSVTCGFRNSGRSTGSPGSDGFGSRKR